MKGAFSWLFRSFALSLSLFVAAQIALVTLGLPLSFEVYARFRENEFHVLAADILMGNDEARERVMRLDTPFFVFSADRNVVFSNRGKGRSIPDQDLQPLIFEGATVGYYSAGEQRFLDTQANRVFFQTLMILLGLSLVAAFVLGLLVARRSAGTISKPVRLLLRDLDEVERLKTVPIRSFEIRELHHMSERLHGVSEMLAFQDAYKRQWMQDISHDLRTPLSGLRGQLEGLQDGVFAPDSRRYGRLLAEVSRMEGMVSGIAELYSLENESSLRVESIDSAGLVDEMLLPFERDLADGEVNVVRKVNALIVRGDRALLVRAAGNVITNAIRFVERGGTLEIGLETVEDGRFVELSIANDGPSIPDDQLALVFRRFYRGESSRSTPGSGLGLSIVQEIAKRHGGQARAENRLPRGVVFIVRLPVSPE